MVILLGRLAPEMLEETDEEEVSRPSPAETDEDCFWNDVPAFTFGLPAMPLLMTPRMDDALAAAMVRTFEQPPVVYPKLLSSVVCNEDPSNDAIVLDMDPGFT